MRQFAWMLVLASLASTLAYGEDHKKWWGVGVGAFRPSSGEIRDKFGDSMIRFGISPFESRISEKWKLIYDITFLSADRDGNRMLVVPLTVGATRSFGDPNGRSIPFVQFGVGPSYFDYSIDRGAQRFETKRVGGNANLELGMLFDKRLAVVFRGDFYTKTDDFDFSGVSLTFSYAALKW